MNFSYIIAFLAMAIVSLAQSDLPAIGIGPPEPSPPGCVDTYDGDLSLLVGAVNDTTLATKVKLKDGVLTDSLGRIGCIVANFQFQFDGPPPQAGAIYTGGFSKCANDSLAIGGSTVWWRCNSGPFDNWYSQKIAEHCMSSNVILHDDKAASSSAARTSTVFSSTSSATASVSSSTRTSSTASVSSGQNTTSSATPSPSRRPSLTSTAVGPATSAASAGAPSSSAAGALATRVPRPETFGAVVGVLGAALFL